MNILRVIPSMNPERGGPCQGIRNLVPEMLKLDVINEVVCLDDPNSVYLQKDNFIIHALGESKGAWAFNSTLPKWLVDNLGRFDAVIIHGLWLYHSYITTKVIRNYRMINKNLKVFILPHGMLDPWFQRDETRKLKALRNEIYWRFIEKDVVNSADGILFTCEQELLLARETFKGYKPKHELNVGYGIVPPPVYTRQHSDLFYESCPQVCGKPYILYLSRLHEKKGVHLLISAYLSLKLEGLSLPALVIAGPGLEKPYGQRLLAQASEDIDILFPGMLIGDAKWGAFYGCEAFVLPSHQENFGIAVVEALACGKPVLISNQVNIWREISESRAGIIDQDTFLGIKSMLLKWVQTTDNARDDMSKNALIAFSREFNISSASKKLAEAIMSN